MGQYVMGYVMGDEGVEGDDVEGDDVEGDMQVVGRRRRGRRRMLALPHKPAWRNRDAAPGVPMPGEGLEILAMVPDSALGVFSAANNGAIITFQARPQRPFRCERFLVTVRRTATAPDLAPQNLAISDGIFVGTTLSQATRGSFDIENFDRTAFGVRMCLVPAEPGVDVTVPVRLLGAALAGTQSLIVSMLFMGRTIQ